MSKQKGIAPIIIVIITIVLAGVGFGVYQSTKTKNQENVNIEKKVEDTKTQKKEQESVRKEEITNQNTPATTTTNQYAGMTRYDNKEFGISFYSKYSDCKFISRDEICAKLKTENGEFRECSNDLFGEFGGSQCGKYYLGYKPIFFDGKWGNWGDAYTKAGQTLSEVSLTLENGLILKYSAGTVTLASDSQVAQAYIEKNGKYFYTSINLDCGIPEPTQSQILQCIQNNQNFKNFLETARTIQFSNLSMTSLGSVYKNTKYGYSISYPKDFIIFSSLNLQKEEVILPTNISDEVKFTNNRKLLFCCEPIVSSISIIPGTIDVKNWSKYVYVEEGGLISEKDIVFAGKKAYELRGRGGYGSSGTRMILIPGEKYSFKIIQGWDGYPWDDITNSLKFE